MAKRKVMVKKGGALVVQYDLTHAQHDSVHCAAHGLFRSLKRGERKNTKLDVTYATKDGDSIRFVGFEPLGADDMRFLQTFVAMAGPRGLLLQPDTESKIAKQLFLFMDPKFETLTEDKLVFKDSMRKLLREAGLPEEGGKNKRLLKKSLIRMSSVSIIRQKGSITAGGFRMLSFAFNEDDGALYVMLNPLITRAIIGDVPYTRINMDEVREVKTDAARLIHQRLCVFVNQGGSHKLNIDTLCSYVWPEKPENIKTHQNHRTKIRKALKELEAIGWIITEYKTWSFNILRPKAKN